MVRLGRGQDEKVGAVSVLKMAQYYARCLACLSESHMQALSLYYSCRSMTAEERSQSEKKARKVIAEQKEKLRKVRVFCSN